MGQHLNIRFRDMLSIRTEAPLKHIWLAAFASRMAILWSGRVAGLEKPIGAHFCRDSRGPLRVARGCLVRTGGARQRVARSLQTKQAPKPAAGTSPCVGMMPCLRRAQFRSAGTSPEVGVLTCSGPFYGESAVHKFAEDMRTSVAGSAGARAGGSSGRNPPRTSSARKTTVDRLPDNISRLDFANLVWELSLLKEIRAETIMVMGKPLEDVVDRTHQEDVGFTYDFAAEPIIRRRCCWPGRHHVHNFLNFGTGAPPHRCWRRGAP